MNAGALGLCPCLDGNGLQTRTDEQVLEDGALGAAPRDPVKVTAL